MYRYESLKLPEKRTSRPLGKIRRAHVKAGIAAPRRDVLEGFAQKLLTAGVPIRERSSRWIAKVVKGESEIAALK
jgi:hypothetical protein